MLRKFGILAIAFCALEAQAKVDAVQAARLGNDLTPLGAERAGNADGTIPAWTGGVTPPAEYQRGMHHPDPYKGDQVSFVIDGNNVAQYADRLPVALKALVERTPGYQMRVFPTRRSAAAPQRIYDATKENATRATLISGGNGIEGAHSGIPFPIPQEGLEVIWNHIMHYKGDQVHILNNQAVVLANGSFNLIKRDRYIYYFYNREGMTLKDLDNTLLYYKYKVLSPAKLAGNALVVQDTLDQILSTRRVWRYNRADRRVRRLPSLAYDSLQPDTNGLATADVVDTYNGAPDRYEWKMIGKKEMLVPYNSYAVHQQGIPYDNIVGPKALNSDLLRYELHRVWVVEAELRPSFNHPYAKRRFYVDEDSWQILAVDLYDKKGDLVGLQESHPISYYEMPLFSSTLETVYDFKGSRYFVDGLDNNEPMYDYDIKLSPRDFSPQALRRDGN
ncbi:DUF1329 domain-containing protein [Pseudomonas mangrovi]|uniref:DUF1329 domain-containing protein n=1 Tax=Pseudomonas mangrovi TaxID=2161748 RepID=A0A2T5P9A3_9PSED|nr:DUF1329 domain-containing protein [Pseudomonas mangrovi]PTU74318.1 DUF1329 domain-containing protein [Pseudomonas mangrovi]